MRPDTENDGERSMRIETRCLSVAVIVAALVAGCSAGGGEESEGGSATTRPADEVTGAAGEPEGGVSWSGAGPYTATSSGGTEVTITAVGIDGAPLRADTIRWRIEAGDAPENAPLTVDVVSPEMPMHGVVRYAAEALGGGAWSVETPIPMEGRWILYVNLDSGVDAAEFPVDVAPSGDGLGGAMHEHGTMEPDGSAADTAGRRRL